jgi:hypothetical protein
MHEDFEAELRQSAARFAEQTIPQPAAAIRAQSDHLHRRKAIGTVSLATALVAGLGFTAVAATATGGRHAAPPVAVSETPVTGPTTEPSSTPSAQAPSTASGGPSVPSTSPTTGQSTVASPACTVNEMPKGLWKGVPNSEGRGREAADIAFRNTSNHACTVSGFPRIRLFDALGNPLPATVTDIASPPATVVTVEPGDWTHTEIGYDPHTAGPGEPTSGPCEPATSSALVRLPSDSAEERVALDVPTSVCLKGDLQAKPFAPGPSSPSQGTLSSDAMIALAKRVMSPSGASCDTHRDTAPSDVNACPYTDRLKARINTLYQQAWSGSGNPNPVLSAGPPCGPASTVVTYFAQSDASGGGTVSLIATCGAPATSASQSWQRLVIVSIGGTPLVDDILVDGSHSGHFTSQY